MSLILDALKRAERERRAILPAFAHPDPSALSQPPGARRSTLRIVLLLAIVGLAVALAAALLLRPSPPLPPPGVPAEPPVAAEPVAELAEVPATEPPAVLLAPAAPAVIPGTEGMVSLEDLAQAEIAVPTPPPAPAASPAPKSTPAAVAPATVAPPTPEDEPAPAEPPAESGGPAPPPALTQPAPLRRFREMTPDYRADFPALTVEVHFYDRDSGQRWVMVNGRRYKQGERMAEGPALLEIVPDGLVVEYRGEKLLYPLTR